MFVASASAKKLVVIAVFFSLAVVSFSEAVVLYHRRPALIASFASAPFQLIVTRLLAPGGGVIICSHAPLGTASLVTALVVTNNTYIITTWWVVSAALLLAFIFTFPLLPSRLLAAFFI